MDEIRRRIAEVIGLDLSETGEGVAHRVLESIRESGYVRQRVEYDADGDRISAYLLLPDAPGPHPAMLIHHQHHGERHLGKSEVCGLMGDPWQAFGPALVQRGFVVLAPDSICFEDRRTGARGVEPLPDDDDFLQHYNAMCYRIIHGDNLMRRVLLDAMCGVALLAGLEQVDPRRIGTMGHSYGGNITLFLAALDQRIQFACASGSACTYRNRMQNGVGIEMASVIPGFCRDYDIDDLVRCTAPRRMLIVSAEADKYSMDAPDIVDLAWEAYRAHGAERNLCHRRYPGGHALTRERFNYIVDWLDACIF